jgi:hypothetical protein
MAEGIGGYDPKTGKIKSAFDFDKIEAEAKASVKPRVKKWWEPPVDAVYGKIQEAKAGIGDMTDRAGKLWSEATAETPREEPSPTINIDEKKQLKEFEDEEKKKNNK